MSIWALHPVHVDAVGYISGRRDLVSSLLFLAAFLAFVPDAKAAQRLPRIAAGMVLFFLAIRTKEMAVTLPAIVVWAILCQNALRSGALRRLPKARWWALAVLSLGAAVFVVVRAFLAPHTRIEGGWWGGSPVTNFATVFKVYGHAFGLMLWPDRLVGDYFPVTIPLARSFAEPAALLGLGLYLALLTATVVAWKKCWRATAFGLGWFLITMLPVSHIIPHHELFAEHYLYLPSMGLLIAVLPAVERLLERPPLGRAVVVGVLCLVALALTARTAARAADYRTNRSFNEAAYALAPNNVRVQYNLGLTYLAAGDCERSVPLLLGAARYLRRREAMSRQNVAAFLRCAEATGHPQVVDTLVAAVLERFTADPLGHAWRGRRLIEQGHLGQAINALELSLVLGGDRDADTVAMLAVALNQAGEHQRALDILDHAPRRHQASCEQEVRALMGLGVSHYSVAFRRVQVCLNDHPDSLQLLETRAGLYFSLGQLEAAEDDLARLQQLGAPAPVVDRVRGWRTVRDAEE